MKYEKAVRYWWTEDGMAEIFDKTECVLEESRECDHCGKKMPKGLSTAKLTDYNGSVYFMHEGCLKKNSQPL